MKIVDAESIIEELQKISDKKYDVGEYDFSLGIDMAICLLEQAKDVDVKPVKHGKRKHYSDCGTTRCPECGAILICAIRYCLGRQTYMPSLITDFIRPLLPHLDNKTLSVIENDIRNAESYGNEKIDKPIWVRFLSEVEEEICRRKEE